MILHMLMQPALGAVRLDWQTAFDDSLGHPGDTRDRSFAPYAHDGDLRRRHGRIFADASSPVRTICVVGLSNLDSARNANRLAWVQRLKLRKHSEPVSDKPGKRHGAEIGEAGTCPAERVKQNIQKK